VGLRALSTQTQHVIVGVGETPCAVFRFGAREHHTVRLPDGILEGAPDWGAYTVDEAALRHGACAQEETTDADEAYARVRTRFPTPEPTRYGEGWLPLR
jgi:hypothetical protein